MRFSRDCDACDGDGQCEFCSVEFHLSAKCVTDQTLDVTSRDLYSADATVTPVDFGADSSGADSGEQRLSFHYSDKEKDIYCRVSDNFSVMKDAFLFYFNLVGVLLFFFLVSNFVCCLFFFFFFFGEL